MKINIIGILAVAALTTACHNNKTVAQPPVLAPPTAQRQTKPRHVPAVPAVAAPQTALSPATEAPRLGQMLTPDQERQYNALIDQSLNSAQSNLRTIGNRKLTAEQQSGVRQIQDFIRQAGETRKSDLVGAKGLADKAQVLARDLVQTLK